MARMRLMKVHMVEVMVQGEHPHGQSPPSDDIGRVQCFRVVQEVCGHEALFNELLAFMALMSVMSVVLMTSITSRRQ